MKTLDEQFNKKFVFNKGEYDCFMGNSSDDTVLPSEVKNFYNQIIKEIVKEMIGLKSPRDDLTKFLGLGLVAGGYNRKRQEIIEIAKKYNINL